MKTHTEPEKKEEMSSQCLYCDSNFEHCQYPQWNLKVHVKEKHPKDYNPMNFSLDKSRSESDQVDSGITDYWAAFGPSKHVYGRQNWQQLIKVRLDLLGKVHNMFTSKYMANIMLHRLI